MKIILRVAAFAAVSLLLMPVQAQIVRYENGFGVMKPIQPVLVGPLIEVDESSADKYWVQKERDDERGKKPKLPSIMPTEDEHTADQALQTEYNNSRTPTINVLFNVTGFTGGAFPPDPVSACGDLHFVVAQNGGSGCQYRVYNKTTGAQIGGTLTFPTSLVSGGSYGDPIVVYDDMADRWVFCEISSVSNRINVYVSQTNNVTTTSWNAYQVPCNGFDYPKLSMWPSAYFLTLNDGGPSVYALDRSQMLIGAATTVITRTATDLSGFGFQALAPVDFDGNNPPPANAPGIMLRHRDTEGHGPGGMGSNDLLEVFEFGPNFASPGSSTWTSTPTQISVSEFSSNLNGWFAFNCFPQPGTTRKLDPLREVIMNRPQYINFGTHQSIVCCHVTDVNGNDRGGVRWYEIRKPAASWTLYQEGTYAPGSDAYSRWMPAISQDLNGNIAIAYSISHSSTIYPGLRMTARSSSDPLGQMTLPEYTIVSGSASQTTIDRWGDYFAMTMDPTNWTTFYFDGEFELSTNSSRIRNFAFNFQVNLLDLNMFDVNNLSAPICSGTSANVEAIIKNEGSLTVTSANIKYKLNGGGAVNIPWTGSLATGQYDTISFTVSGLTVNFNNSLQVYTENPNGGTDDDFNNDTLTISIPVSSNLSGSATQVQDIQCYNANDGQLSLSGSGGLSPYTYSTGGPYSGSSFYNSMGPGTYTCSVQDAAGCIYTITPAITYTNPPAITGSSSVVDASSASSNDGSITITASGGTGTLQYNLNGGSYQASNVFNGLGPGSYTINVQDANGCIFTIVVNVGQVDLGVGTNPLENAIRIYPNPTSGKLSIGYLSTYTAQDATLELFDMSGKAVKSMYLGELTTGQIITIDLTGIASGAYSLRLSSGEWSTQQRVIFQ